LLFGKAAVRKEKYTVNPQYPDQKQTQTAYRHSYHEEKQSVKGKNGLDV
jgi:hypothetical protein